MVLPLARQEGVTAAWKSRDIKPVVSACRNVNEAREWLAYLFAVVHERLELCRFIEQKINVPCPEGFKLFKILLSLTKELTKLDFSRLPVRPEKGPRHPLPVNPITEVRESGARHQYLSVSVLPLLLPFGAQRHSFGQTDFRFRIRLRLCSRWPQGVGAPQ